jgi:leader peptidase (prepilin peptidase)/N-methyltransferase
MEVGVAVIFVASYLLWPESLQTAAGLSSFVLWLVAVVMLAILFAYDLKWFLLPDQIVFPLIGTGIVMSAIQVGTAPSLTAFLSIVGAVVVLSGLYFALWLYSKGQWVGFGDVKLGLALALLLADWRLALVALFSANLIGSLLVIPGMLTGKLGRKSHVPFGPLLIAGAVVAMLIGERVITLYMGALF